MSGLWFYGRGADISGPVTMPELATLVAAGDLLATDTIWRDGIEDGVPASQMPELFPSTASSAASPKKARAVAG